MPTATPSPAQHARKLYGGAHRQVRLAADAMTDAWLLTVLGQQMPP
jgi:hypothetical protein